jgi:hypothetical protein
VFLVLILMDFSIFINFDVCVCGVEWGRGLGFLKWKIMSRVGAEDGGNCIKLLSLLGKC